MNPIRIATILSCLIAAQPAVAAWLNIDVLNADDLLSGTSGVHFGQSVAADVLADGSIRALYVGAPNATVVRNNITYAGAGAVYVLVKNGEQWAVIDRIEATINLQANAHFGAAVAVSNGSIIIGEPDYDNATHTNAGRVFEFQDYTRNTQNAPAFLLLGGLSTDIDHARLGASVAVSGGGLDTPSHIAATRDGSFFFAGAPGALGAGCVHGEHLGVTFNFDEDSENLGSVCSGNSGDAFGASVAARSLGEGQVSLIVGAPGTIQNGNALAGAAHAYVRVNGTLTLIDTLVAPNPTMLDAFGTSVAIDSEQVYVGATGRDLVGVGRTGSVSLFEPAFILGYDFARELFPTEPREAGDLCGASLSLDAATGVGFAVGCPGSDGSVGNQGAVRVYRPFVFMGNPVWTSQRVELANEPHGADDLGRSVVLVDDRLYAGAPFANDTIGADNGGVFEFGNGVVLNHVFANSFE